HVAQLTVRVVGDADLHDSGVVRLLHVFVLLGVAQVVGNLRHGESRALGWRCGAKVTGAGNACQANGLPDGNRSARGGNPAAPSSTSASRSPPQGRRSRRTATGSGSSLK